MEFMADSELSPPNETADQKILKYMLYYHHSNIVLNGHIIILQVQQPAGQQPVGQQPAGQQQAGQPVGQAGGVAVGQAPQVSPITCIILHFD